MTVNTDLIDAIVAAAKQGYVVEFSYLESFKAICMEINFYRGDKQLTIKRMLRDGFRVELADMVVFELPKCVELMNEERRSKHDT